MIRLACASITCDGLIEDRCFDPTFQWLPTIGLANVEFNCWYPHTLTPTGINLLKERCQSVGLTPAALHVAYFGGADFREVTKDVCHKLQAIEATKRLGCRRVCATATARGTKGGLPAVIECLKEIAPEAERQDVLLCVENHAGSNLATLEDYQRLCDAIPSDHVGICMDTGHLEAAGIKPADFIDQFHSRINHIHLKENARFGEEHFVRFGEGVTDNDYAIRRMIDLGYNGYLTIELCLESRDGSPTLTDVQSAVKRFKRYETD